MKAAIKVTNNGQGDVYGVYGKTTQYSTVGVMGVCD
jgi:hypothetical protein